MRSRQRSAPRASFFLAGIAIATISLMPGEGRAATLIVDARGGTPHQTIQSAIDAAFPGVDDVLVRCGVYAENITMRDEVSVVGAGPRCTVIDGGAAGTVVTMIDIGSATVLEGFTIRNGSAGFGGGIYIESGSPVIRGNIVEGNAAVDLGGGEGEGGGIYVTGPVSGLLASVTAPEIVENVVRDNTADTFGGGIEISEDDGSTVIGNLVFANTAVEAGGGIDVYQSFPTIANNTVVRNCLQGGGTACSQGGGGIAFTNSGVLDMASNVVAWNEAAVGGGVDLIGTTVNFTSNDVFGNVPDNYSGIRDPTGSNGNISDDPLFVDEALNGFQPRSDSPLLEVADGTFAPPSDLQGIPRPQDGDADGSGEPDIGARENEGVTRLLFVADSDTDLEWDASIEPFTLFNLYRGDLQVLRDTGVYTQDTGTVSGARRQCGLVSPSASDTDDPDPGAAFFYIAVLDNLVEGSLGFDSAPAERPYETGNRCP